MNPLTAEVKAIIGVILFVAIAWFAYVVYGWHEAAQKNAATATQLDHTAIATSGITADASAAQTQSAKVDATVSQARDSYARHYQELRHEDPSVVQFGDQPIPQRLRDLARTRRSARDGPSSDAAGSSRDGAGADGAGSSTTP